MYFLIIGRKKATGNLPDVQRYVFKKATRIPTARIHKLIEGERDNFLWATLSDKNGSYLGYYFHSTGTTQLTHSQYKLEVEQYKDDTGTRLCALIPSHEGRAKGITQLLYIRIAEADAADELQKHLPDYFKIQLYQMHQPYREMWMWNGKVCTKNLITQ